MSLTPVSPAVNSLTSPPPAASFLASSAYSQVPDTYGAVGTNSLLTILNTGTHVQTRTGVSVNTNTLSGFWGTNAFTADPRAIYDPFNHRWIATSVMEGPSTNSYVLIGVSATSSPTNGWYRWAIGADTNSIYWADLPTVGFNKAWIVVQANMIGLTNRFLQRSHVYVFNKTNLYAGGSLSPKLFVLDHDDTYGSEVPAITYDNSVSTLYLVQNANGNTNGNGYLRLFTITGPVGSETLNNVTNNITYVSVPETWGNEVTNWISFAPQRTNAINPTGEVKVGTAPDAKLQDVIYRNGSLWCTHTIFLPAENPTRCSVQWWQIRPSTGEILQRGRLDDPLGVNYYAFPSIAVNKFNDVLIGYSSFSATQFASGAYSFRAFYDDQNKLRGGYTYKWGEDVFDGRWGDYSSSTVDPVNDPDLWTIQEYARTNIGLDQWGTQWAYVTAPVPTNDHFSAGYTISGPEGTTNGTTIRATRETSEPNHAGKANTPSAWYTWIAPGNGHITLQLTNTFVMGSQAALAVYTGSSVSSLTLVTNSFGGDPAVTFNASSGNTYRIAVSGYNKSASDFTLTWKQPTAPYFVQHPQTTNVVVGENVTLSSVAIGSPTPSYQWRHEGTNLVGKTSASLALTNVQLWQSNNYTVVASNNSGTTTSSVALLVIHGNSAARLSEFAMETNAFRLHISGVTNRSYVVQTSTNLNSATNWYTIHTDLVSFWYTNYPTTGDLRRFYRAITNT